MELANTKRYASRTRKEMSYVIRKWDMVVIAVHRLKWKEDSVQLCEERVNGFDESVVGISGEGI